MTWTNMYAKAIVANDGEAMAQLEDQLNEVSYVVISELEGPNSYDFESLREKWERERIDEALAIAEKMQGAHQ